jgi:hypothetical protein
MTEFVSNPNQKNVNINKLKIENKDDYYAKFRLDALQLAMNKLTPKAFELWCYLGKNMDGFKLYLSKVDCLRWCNISESSYHRAFEELVNARYLIPKDKQATNPTQYDFYEFPQEEDESKPEITIHNSNESKEFMF